MPMHLQPCRTHAGKSQSASLKSDWLQSCTPIINTLRRTISALSELVMRPTSADGKGQTVVPV